MNKIFLYFFLFSFSYFTNAQNVAEDDYILLNSVLNQLTFIKTNDTIHLSENPIKFSKQKEFFTKENFQGYINYHPDLGVNEDEVKKMICKLDFDYLANQKRDTEKWVDEKFTTNIIVSIPKDTYSKGKMEGKMLGISKPIYTKNKKIAFIYYQESYVFNKYVDSASTTVRAYKKIRGKWVYITLFSISMS